MKPIIDWITGFFGFIVDMFAALFDLLYELMFTIPVGVLIVVCVLYKILGRENQS